MITYSRSVILRNDGTDPSTSKKDLNAAVAEPITVRHATVPPGNGAIASIFDINDAPISNPFNTDNKGNYSFRAADGVYDVIAKEGTGDVTITPSESLISASAPNDRVIPFDNLDLAINETNPIKIFNGASLNLKERTAENGGGAMWDVVLAASVTPNTSNIVQCVGVPSLALVMRLTHSMTIEQFGATEGSDISSLLGDMVAASEVKTITSNIVTSVEMSVVATVERGDLTITLPDLTWTGDYDLYSGGATDRQVGIITVTGSRDTDTPLLITSAIEEFSTTHTLADTTGLVEGGYAVMIGGDKYNYLVGVEKINGLDVTFDYAAGWDELANIVSIYAASPLQNVNVSINSITDTSGATVDVNQVTGVTFLDTVGGSCQINDAADMANPLLLTRRAHSLSVPYMDSREPRYTDSGRGYTAQFNGSLFCTAGTIKGTKVRHVVDYTRCGYCHLDDMFDSGESIGHAYSTHGQYEHDIDVDRIHTSKESNNTLSIANAGLAFGERTKRFKINERAIINGQFDVQNAEDVSITGARVVESDFVRLNANCKLNDCDFANCTSFRVRSRVDRPQRTIAISGGRYPDIEIQDFTGVIEATDADMKWFVNQDVVTIPNKIKTFGCTHEIELSAVFEATSTIMLSNPTLTVPNTSASVGVIVEVEKLIISNAESIFTPLISLDGARAKSLQVNGFVDLEPNANRSSALFRLRNVSGVKATITGAICEFTGTGDVIEFDRSGNTNITAVVCNNQLNGIVNVKAGFGSVTKGTFVGNILDDITQLPADGVNFGVSSNIDF